jgi:rare lipoprotein A
MHNVGVNRRMFPLAMALCVTSAGCAVVGYPAPVRGPANVVARALPPAAAALSAPIPAPSLDRAASPYVRAAVRSYEVFGRTYTTLPTSEGYSEVGIASWYGAEFDGRRTASGEAFDMHALTAAHRTLPLSTCVEVRRTDNNKSVVVRVNDRGPFGADTRRIIDVSYSAGLALGLIGTGTARVELRALDATATC